MAIQYQVQSEGTYIAYGLSSDTKPESPPTGATFIELDTNNIYTVTAGAWVLSLKHKRIKALSDFPTPIATVITLEDNTTYLIVGTVDIGANTIQLGVRNTFIGADKFNDILTGTTSGTLITMDGTTTSKVATFFTNMTLKSPNGTLFSMTAPSVAQVMVIDNCNLTASASMGTFNNVTSLSIRNSGILNLTTGGFAFTGTNTNLIIRDNQFRLNVGTVFNLGTAVFTTISISRNLVDEAVTQTFVSGTTGGANVTNAGQIADNIFSGAGTFVSTITVNDTKWNFKGNVGTTNTPLTVADGGMGASTLTGVLIGTGTGAVTGLAGTASQFLRRNADNTAFEFATIAGGGDVVGPVISVASQIALFDGVTGKLIKADATTGIVKSTAGVISAAVGDTDYTLPATTALKAPLANPTFTGTIAGITSAMVGSPAGSGNSSGTNTGDQSSIVGITGTIAQFNTAITDGDLATGGGTATGTNTGDNATNSQYSGLVSNATHTGDATGATALTVVKINGVALSGLATGILKNTTTTGAPSIAINSDLPTMSSTVGGAVPTPPNNTTTFLRGDGTFAAPAGGSGDMVLASAQTNSGIKTFLDTTMKLRNVANTFDGYFVNTNTANRIYTLKDAAGTLAFTSDITGTNSGTNTGDQTLPTDATIVTTDVTTNNATTSKHGWMPKGTGSTSTFFRSDMTQAAPTASVSITQVEIDLGTTPVSEASISVVDTGITASSKIIGGIAYVAPTGKDLDELEMDAFDIKFEPLSGTMNVKIKGLEGYIADKFVIWYTFA